MMNLKHILLILKIINIAECLNFFSEKVLKIDKFDGVCEGHEDLPMTLQNVSFTYNEKLMVINAKLFVKHDLTHQIEQVLDMTRCSNREALDTCEKYNSVKFTRCCDLLKTRGQLWSPFIDSIHPQIRCPVKAGIYSLDNATFAASVSIIPIDGWYWRVGVKSFDSVTKEQLLCMQVEAEVQTINRKNK